VPPFLIYRNGWTDLAINHIIPTYILWGDDMVIQIRKLLLIVFLVISITTFFIFFLHKETAPTYKAVSDADGDEKTYHKVVISLLMSNIEAASKNFYKDYFTINPTVAENDVIVLDIDQTDEGSYKIVFRTLPYLGPHLTVGCDEISLIVSQDSSVRLEGLSHIESYELPSNMQNLVTKPLPSGNDT